MTVTKAGDCKPKRWLAGNCVHVVFSTNGWCHQHLAVSIHHLLCVWNVYEVCMKCVWWLYIYTDRLQFAVINTWYNSQLLVTNHYVFQSVAIHQLWYASACSLCITSSWAYLTFPVDSQWYIYVTWPIWNHVVCKWFALGPRITLCFLPVTLH